MIYRFSIPKEINEKHQAIEDNIVHLQVYDSEGNEISDSCRYAEIYLSDFAKIGLGTELIRLAHNFEEGKEIHIKPSSKEHGAHQEMGIFLTPDSCELTIKCESFEPIETYLEEYKKTHPE
jgi:hypothetical protein